MGRSKQLCLKCLCVTPKSFSTARVIRSNAFYAWLTAVALGINGTLRFDASSVIDTHNHWHNHKTACLVD